MPPAHRKITRRFLAAAIVTTGASAVADPLSAGSSARLLPRLCDGCFAEPYELDYFSGTVGGEPPRLQSPSRQAFDRAALAGKAMIVENATVGSAMEGWSCDRLAQEFPKAKMRREYDWVKNPEDRNLQKLGDAKWAETAVPGVDAGQRLSQDPSAPPFAPFYWGVREWRGGDVGSKKVIKRVKELIAGSVPSFMEQEHNAQGMFDNAEFWLGAKGTGARAHMDSHCISTLSVVLKGERRWRIGPVPRMPKGAGRSRQDDVVFDDGVAYKLGWKPLFEFTVKEGEAVLFPPGWIHETLNTAEGCTVALTTQFVSPLPVQYWRSYYQRLRRVGDLNPCWANMIEWASHGQKANWAKMSPKEVRSYAKQHFDRQISNATLPREVQDFYDLDGDGQVSRTEFVETFVSWTATELAVRREKEVRMPRPDMSLKMEGEEEKTSKARPSEL